MYRLFTFSPNPDDGTAVYRSFGALPRIREIEISRIQGMGNVGWSHLMSADAVFLQRPFMPEQVALAQLAKTYKKPIISDYDDFLFAVQDDNPTHATYGAHASKQNVEACCRMSNALLVSTEELKGKLHAFNDNIVVVPNAIDFDLIDPLPVETPRHPLVVWRGGSSHQEDLREHTEAILEAHEKFPAFQWVFLGFNPWWITKRMDAKRYRYIPFAGSYPQYMKNLIKLRGAIHIVPLTDNVFNRCKSNISVLEGVTAGSVVLAPDWEAFRGFGAVPYVGAEGFKAKLQELLAMPLETLGAMNGRAFEDVRAYRNLRLMNELRVGAFRKYGGMH